jgi:hypothetical protein
MVAHQPLCLFAGKGYVLPPAPEAMDDDAAWWLRSNGIAPDPAAAGDNGRINAWAVAYLNDAFWYCPCAAMITWRSHALRAAIVRYHAGDGPLPRPHYSSWTGRVKPQYFCDADGEPIYLED